MNLQWIALYIYMSGWRDALKHVELRLEGEAAANTFKPVREPGTLALPRPQSR